MAGLGRLPAYAKEGTQAELARIDRSVSSGASYAMKYLLKTVDGGDALNSQVALFPQEQTAAQARRRREHLAAARRVDAYRSLWGINAGQLFGVAKCLTAWDELRRLSTAPEHPQLRRLWALARGSEEEGRIPAGAGQRGDAKAFLEALGGLAASGTAAARVVPVLTLGRLTEPGTNGYGDRIERTKGVTLVRRTRVRVVMGTVVSKRTGELRPRTAWRSARTVVASVRTRAGEWTLVAKRHAGFAIHLAEMRFASLPEIGGTDAAEVAESPLPLPLPG